MGLNGVDERCVVVEDASACSGARCSRLALVFSGGEEGCGSASYAPLLQRFADAGYATACINPFESAVGSGAVPYVDEAERYDRSVREATQSTWAQAYWTGEHLLLAGVSHGATAPLILMARTALDDGPAWHGTRTTGGCFLDGSYDQQATAELLRTGAADGGPCTVPVPYRRWLARYCGPSATAANCDLSTQAAALADTITTVSPSEFAIRDLRLVECGSALPTCASDILPAAPIEALCSGLNQAPDHRCEHAAMPNVGHATCFGPGSNDCRTWFEQLIKR